MNDQHFPLYLDKRDIKRLHRECFMWISENKFKIVKENPNIDRDLKLFRRTIESDIVELYPSQHGIKLTTEDLVEDFDFEGYIWKFDNGYDMSKFRRFFSENFDLIPDSKMPGIYFFAPKQIMALNIYQASIDLFSEKCCTLCKVTPDC